MAADRGVDGAGALNKAVHDGDVLARDAMRLQLLHQGRLRGQCFGDDQKPAGVLVEPVHDASARNFFKRGRVLQQGIEQRARPIAAAGVHHQPGRFVNDDQVLVLVNDIESDLLSNRRCVDGRRHGEAERLLAGGQRNEGDADPRPVQGAEAARGDTGDAQHAVAGNRDHRLPAHAAHSAHRLPAACDT